MSGRRAVDENGTLLYTSASAFNKHAACRRKWWFTYHEGLPDPAGPEAELGKEIHTRIETYLKGGPNVLGPIELPALEFGYIPAPGPDLMVEHRLEIAERTDPATGETRQWDQLKRQWVKND